MILVAVLESLFDLKPFLEFIIDLLDDTIFNCIANGKTEQDIIEIFIADVGRPGKIDDVSEPEILVL